MAKYSMKKGGKEVGPRNHPALFQPDRQGRSGLPDPAASGAKNRGIGHQSGRDDRPLRRRFPHAGARTGAPVS